MAKRDLGMHLVGEGILNADQLRQVVAAQQAGGGRLDTVVLEMGYCGEGALLDALGRFHRARTATALDLAGATPEVARLISPRVAKRFEIVPFHLDGKKLSVASLTPGDLLVEDEIGVLTGCMVTTFAALEVRLYEALARLYRIGRSPRLQSVSRRLAGTVIPGRPEPPPPVSEPQLPPATPSLAADGSFFEQWPVVMEQLPIPAETVPETVAAPVVEETATAPAPPPPPPPPRPRSSAVTELEISDEDLELFPSLRLEAEPEELVPMAEELVAEELVAAGEVTQPIVLSPEPAPAIAETTEVTEVSKVVPPRPVVAVEEVFDPELRLAAASVELLNAEMREDIADTLLAYCAPFLRRRALFILRGDQVVGWRAEGDGVEPGVVREVVFPSNEPSVFLGLIQGAGFWLSSLPPMPHNKELVRAIGGHTPPECVVLPVVVKSKPVCFLYGDNLDTRLGELPMARLRRLVNKAGVAFQVYILKSKIRTM